MPWVSCNCLPCSASLSRSDWPAHTHISPVLQPPPGVQVWGCTSTARWPAGPTYPGNPPPNPLLQPTTESRYSWSCHWSCHCYETRHRYISRLGLQLCVAAILCLHGVVLGSCVTAGAIGKHKYWCELYNCAFMLQPEQYIAYSFLTGEFSMSGLLVM